MPPCFTVLLPVVRPPALLPFAIESVLAQRLAEFELVVICDGAPPETVECARSYARRDPRIAVLDHPKGARNGEAYRHPVLMESTAPYAAHICDDDVWLPNHLDEMRILLARADFGNLLHVYAHPDGTVEVLPGDLARPATRERMLAEPFNIFGTTYGGYRLDAYRRLAEGWSPAPPDVWPDLHMWRKFLARDDLRIATRAAITAVHFASPQRRDLPLDERADETRRFVALARDPERLDEIVQAAWLSLIGQIDEGRVREGALASAHAAMEIELGRHVALHEAARRHVAEVTEANEAAAGEIRRLVAELATERARMSSELARHDGLHETARAHVAEVTEALAGAESESRRLHAEHARTESETRRLADGFARDRAGMQAELDRHDALHEAARAHVAHVTDAHAAAEDEIRRLHDEHAKVQDEARRLEAALAAARAEIARLAAGSGSATAPPASVLGPEPGQGAGCPSLSAPNAGSDPA